MTELESKAPASSQLVGLQLNDGWNVVEAIPTTEESTGGKTSHRYLVKNSDGDSAFLKALDFSSAFEENGIALANVLFEFSDSYRNEVRINESCAEKKLSRVAYSIGSGGIQVPGYSTMEGNVLYLIFKVATGDIRQKVDMHQTVDILSTMRALKDICLGLWQLHRLNIAHQDLKPSNILDYGHRKTMITDLGSSSQRGEPVVHNEKNVVGDKSYAPPELLYGHLDSNFNVRRMGADIYNLGSISAYLFTGIDMNSELYKNLDQDFHPKKWKGSYDEILPYLMDAFGIALANLKSALPKVVSDFIYELICQLCTPDYKKRGHPKNIGTPRPYDLERYHSYLNYWLSKLEIRLKIEEKKL